MVTVIERVIATAQAEVGYYEKASNAQLDSKTANKGRSNYTKYARDLDALGIYNGPKNGYYWCDVFVDWLFIKTFGVDAGLKMINQTKGDCGAGCTFSAQYYKNIGRLFYSNPQPGDQIFFGNRSTGDYYHTGLVYKVENGYVYTIEGNTSANDGVNGNGDGVARKCYSLSYSEIGAYGRPRWELAPADKKEDDKMLTYEEFKAYQERYEQEKAKKAAGGWANRALAFCKEKGLMVGDKDGSMRPQSNITRQEVAQVLFALMGGGKEAHNYAKEAWEKAHVAGILDGMGAREPLTREQFAAVLDRLGLIPDMGDSERDPSQPAAAPRA